VKNRRFDDDRLVLTSTRNAQTEKPMDKAKRWFAAVLTGFLMMTFSWWSQAHAQSLDEVYQKALAEGGTLNFYGTLAPNQASKILLVFEKRFPGIKIHQTDLTSDALAARAIAEARGGKTIADAFRASLEIAIRLDEGNL
jgi:hypothetical protein